MNNDTKHSFSPDFYQKYRFMASIANNFGNAISKYLSDKDSSKSLNTYEVIQSCKIIFDNFYYRIKVLYAQVNRKMESLEDRNTMADYAIHDLVIAVDYLSKIFDRLNCYNENIKEHVDHLREESSSDKLTRIMLAGDLKSLIVMIDEFKRYVEVTYLAVDETYEDVYAISDLEQLQLEFEESLVSDPDELLINQLRYETYDSVTDEFLEQLEKRTEKIKDLVQSTNSHLASTALQVSNLKNDNEKTMFLKIYMRFITPVTINLFRTTSFFRMLNGKIDKQAEFIDYNLRPYLFEMYSHSASIDMVIASLNGISDLETVDNTASDEDVIASFSNLMSGKGNLLHNRTAFLYILKQYTDIWIKLRREIHELLETVRFLTFFSDNERNEFFNLLGESHQPLPAHRPLQKDYWAAQ